MAVAAGAELRSSVVTFHPHPISVLRPELAPRELSTPQRKLELVAELGPDELVVIRFDLGALADRTHEEFATDVIAGALGARHVVVGTNFRYGHRAQGTVETLRRAGAAARLHGRAGPAGRDRRRRRVVLADPRPDRRRARSPRPPGCWAARRGSKAPSSAATGAAAGSGFATANLQPVPRQRAAGARASTPGSAHLPGSSRPAAISVGYNPTFSDARDQVRIEAHLLDFDEDIYGSPMRIDFSAPAARRGAVLSIDELVAQIHRDVDAVREIASA